MVVTVDHASEAVFLPPPAAPETNVYSLLDLTGHRRYKTEVELRPKLAPVRFSSTCYIQTLTSTRRRYVSRTTLRPRPRPCRYAETTFTSPAAASNLYVTTVDMAGAARRRYKQVLHVDPRHFRSELSVQRTTDVNSNTITHIAEGVCSSNGYPSNGVSGSISNGAAPNGLSNEETVQSRVGGGLQAIFDPGASQVYIPRKRERDAELLMNGGLRVDFPNQNGFVLDPERGKEENFKKKEVQNQNGVVYDQKKGRDEKFKKMEVQNRNGVDHSAKRIVDDKTKKKEIPAPRSRNPREFFSSSNDRPKSRLESLKSKFSK